MEQHLLSKYPDDIQHHVRQLMRRKKRKTDVAHILETILPQQLGDNTILLELLNIEIQLIDPYNLVDSNVKTISIPFEGNPESWYDDLCKEYGVVEWFCLDDSIAGCKKKCIKNFTREDFMYVPIIYGLLKDDSRTLYGLDIHSFSINQNGDLDLEVPLHYDENKLSHIHQWVHKITYNMTANLADHIRTMKKEEFYNFVHKEGAQGYMQLLLEKLLNTESLYAYSNEKPNHHVKTLSEYIKRYLHFKNHETSGMECVKKFFELYFIYPVQYLLYNMKVRFENFISHVHERNHRQHQKSEMSSDDFGAFWLHVFSLYQKRLAHVFDSDDAVVTTLKQIEMYGRSENDTIKNICIKLCDSIISSEQRNQETHYEEPDEYRSYYSDIRMPHYFRWIKTNGTHLPHVSHIVKHLQEPNGRLILGSSGSRKESKLLSQGKTIKEMFPKLDEYENKKDQVLFFRDLDGTVTPYDLNSLSISSYDDEPLFTFSQHETVGSGNSNRNEKKLHIGTINGNWYRYNPNTRHIELQPTKLSELKDQFIFLLVLE